MRDGLISRQAAIDAMSVINDSICEQQAIDALCELPSAQPEPMIISIDPELTHDEFEKLRKDLADAPIVLMPSAQPEIIRCKDCKHYDGRRDVCHNMVWGDGWANYPPPTVYEDDFCSHAERRTDG